MKGTLDPEYADWVNKVGGEGTVFTGVVPAVILTLVTTIIPTYMYMYLMYLPVQQHLMEQIKATVSGSAVDSVGEWLKVQSLKCPTLSFESWRCELKLSLVEYWMI